MAYSDSLALRVRAALMHERGITERKMFGGLAILQRGNMFVIVWQESLIVRVGADGYQEALQLPCAAEFNVTGRPMTGWVLVAADGIDADRDLHAWIERGAGFWQDASGKELVREEIEIGERR